MFSERQGRSSWSHNFSMRQRLDRHTHTHAVCLPLAHRNRVTEKPTARKRCLPLISWRAQSTGFGKYGGTTATQNTDCFSQEVSILEGFLQTNYTFPSVFHKCSCACEVTSSPGTVISISVSIPILVITPCRGNFQLYSGTGATVLPSAPLGSAPSCSLGSVLACAL